MSSSATPVDVARPRLRRPHRREPARFLLRSRRDARRPRLRGRGRRGAAPSRCSSTHAPPLPVPQLVVADARAAMAAAADVFFGHPTRRARGRRRDGDEREDDDGVPAPRDLRGRGQAPGPRRHGRDARRRRAPAARAERRPRRSTSSACSRDARRGGPQLRDGGAPRTRPRWAGSTASRFAALGSRTSRRTTSTSTGRWSAYFEAKRRLFVADRPPRAAVNVGDE